MLLYYYREYKGDLKESMKSLKKFYTLYGLINYISKKEKCDKKDISISLYFDDIDYRTNWDYTFLVCINTYPCGYLTNKIN